MHPDIINQAIPDADHEFVATLRRLPDPPAGSREKILETLPMLHELFLQKRQAAQNGDQVEFMRIVEREVELIGEWDEV